MNLLSDIDRYLHRTGVSETTFGRRAVNDPRLIRDLRRGRVPGPRVCARVEAIVAGATANAHAFERAVVRSAGQAGVTLSVERHRAVAWHSATFSGDRHELVVGATAEGGVADWAARLPTMELVIPSYLLADLRVPLCERIGDIMRVRIEGLTVAIG